jgi:hypothetical protein
MAELRKADQPPAAQKADQIARQAAQKDPEPECECCGCPEREACELQDADESLASVIYDAEPGDEKQDAVLRTLMLLAKQAGYYATATAAFDTWLDIEG